MRIRGILCSGRGHTGLSCGLVFGRQIAFPVQRQSGRAALPSRSPNEYREVRNRVFNRMKKIEAMIRPYKQDEILQALARSGALTESSASGVSVVEAIGFGRQQGHSEVYRGAEQGMGLVPKRMLVMYVSDDQVDSVVKLIRDIACTGEFGDGKIAVLPMDNLTRIRTGEAGEAAL